MFNKLSGWGGSATAADQESPVSQEFDHAAQVEPQTTPTKHMMESGKHNHHHHHHQEIDGTQEEEVLAQEGRVVKERHLMPGAEGSLHYLDGVPLQETSLPQETSSTYIQQETTIPLQEASPSPQLGERTLAVYEPPRHETAQAPASSTTLVTVKSISAEERDRQIHEENMRRAQLQEEQMKVEASAFMEKQKRDTIAYMQKEEARAQAKYDKAMADAAYREAQVQKKAADLIAEAAAARKKAELRAQQKLDISRTKAKVLAEEHLATAKVRGTAIQKGDVRAELTNSWSKKFSRKLKL